MDKTNIQNWQSAFLIQGAKHEDGICCNVASWSDLVDYDFFLIGNF